MLKESRGRRKRVCEGIGAARLKPDFGKFAWLSGNRPFFFCTSVCVRTCTYTPLPSSHSHFIDERTLKLQKIQHILQIHGKSQTYM